MGLRSMNWDEWIGELYHADVLNSWLIQTELDNHYLRYHADKKRRIEERGAKACQTAPEAMDGAIELLEELYVANPTFNALSDICKLFIPA